MQEKGVQRALGTLNTDLTPSGTNSVRKLVSFKVAESHFNVKSSQVHKLMEKKFGKLG
jgi:hypothetical protein